MVKLLDELNKYYVYVGLLISAIAYFFGYLRKLIYLNLLEINASPLDIYDPISFYLSGLLFVISAIIFPVILVLCGNYIYVLIYEKIVKRNFFKRYMYALLLLIAGVIFFSIHFLCLYINKLVFTEPIAKVFSFVLYLVPIPILQNSFGLIILVIISYFLGIAFIVLGFFLHKYFVEANVNYYKIRNLIILSAFCWLSLLFVTQTTETILNLELNVSTSNVYSNNELLSSWIITKDQIDEIDKTDVYESNRYYTKCVLLNFKNKVYYIAVKSFNKYSLYIIPEDRVIGLSQADLYDLETKRINDEKKRINNILNMLNQDKYRVFNQVKLYYQGKPSNFDNIIVSNNVVFNLIISHYNATLNINDSANVIINRDGNKEGVVFLKQLDLAEKEWVLKQILNSNQIPIVNVIVLANKKAIVENQDKYLVKIVKFDNLLTFIKSYNINTSPIDPELVENILLSTIQ